MVYVLAKQGMIDIDVIILTYKASGHQLKDSFWKEDCWKFDIQLETVELLSH